MKQCPLCKMDVPEFLFEPDIVAVQPVISRIKQDNPSWAEQHGACSPCLELYQNISGRVYGDIAP